MNQRVTLHLCGWDKKFVPAFKELIDDNFAADQHKFIVYGAVDSNSLTASSNTAIYSSLLRNFFDISRQMHFAKKIILHGLFSNHLMYILFLQPWLLEKCYWVIWGGDLYIHNAKIKDWRWKKDEYLRKFLIPRIAYLITYIPGDVQLARRWYGARGEYIECLMYPSNIFTKVDLPSKIGSSTNIMVGNSADPSNNHLEVLDKLRIYKDMDINIYCPLSYGDANHAEKVAKAGELIFGSKFIPMLSFMPLNKYIEFLGQIDVAVFAHNRQQGMGNTVTLLGLGKKVYTRRDVTHFDFFQRLGITIFDCEDLNLKAMSEDVGGNNVARVKEYFSKRNLLNQLRAIFA